MCFFYLPFCFLQIVVLDARKHFEDKTLNSDLSHTSLLENEKLLLPTSLEDSSGTASNLCFPGLHLATPLYSAFLQ